MTQWNARVEAFKRELLAEYLDECSHAQRELFYKIFGNGTIAIGKLDNAIDLCERTVIKNRKNPERMSQP